MCSSDLTHQCQYSLSSNLCKTLQINGSHSAGVAAVGGDLNGCRSRILCRRLGIRDADRMVIPGALGAEDGQLEIGIDSRNGDVKAVYFVAGAVGVGHRVNGRLQPVALVGGGVGGHARIQVVDNVDLIPSNMNLSGAEIELVDLEDKEFILKKITDKLRRKYDYIIMDCPPSLSMLTINALTAATSVLVPIQCEYYALEGLSQLIHTIELVRDRLNKRLKIEGVVFTMYDARTNLSLQVVENVKENLDQNIYKTIIPRNVRLAEAPSYGKPINLYDSRSTGAESYRLLAEEVIGREGE